MQRTARIPCLPADRAGPARIIEALESRGAAVVAGLEPDTPAAMLRFAESLGTLDTGIDELLLGPRVMQLRHDPDRAAHAGAPSYFTADEFPLHTDVSYVPRPPRYVLMHCVWPDTHGGACLLASCDQAARSLPPAMLEVLREPVFRFRYPPGCPAGESAPVAVREASFWRFKFGSMAFPERAAEAVNRFRSVLLAECATIHLRRGDLLIFDNHRSVHGRTAFDPAPAGRPARLMMRVYANSRAVQTA